ncbi:hypothetical protein OIDMADRAFT_204080 [Oidiodendron maius Zn]|uniref:Zn(2)-C6 fungal-type domain-containing protein n=1 Tax=Oidiodendron maius (strain Zn) TaxID=913774 RepID=A0A0C3H1V2_OIDMZ|nr:hypothetical protein OIDMADRAFT_204080 [Oidiodendron maius Zn]
MESTARTKSSCQDPKTSRRKVKTGCRTCKIRRVKCDETRPSCHRCVSTGRTCDGYGIWAGGKASHTPALIGPKSCNIPRQPATFFALALSSEERSRFEFFRCRSSKKVQGIFSSYFWETLVFQVSTIEPAVLHAILALSSVQVAAVTDNCSHPSSITLSIPDKQEEFTLRHYIKAIGHLHPHLSAKHTSSIRVALIACVVFVCLDFFRGHNKSAQAHLLSGLKLLTDIQNCSDTVDDWIAEAFYRLHVQVGLFNHGYEFPQIALRPLESEPQPPIFHSMRQARNYLDQLMDKVIHLTQLGLQNADSIPSQLVDCQKSLRAEFASWRVTFKASKSNLLADGPVRGEYAYRLLHMYYVMGSIMAHACIWPTCEWIFDLHRDDFATIIAIAVNLRKRTLSAPKRLIGDDSGISKAIGDIGWIPPLYYAAIKCRVHRIRLQAIRLLDASPHKEMIWDSDLLAAVAQKVMEIEERGFYEDKDARNTSDINVIKLPETRHFFMPALPSRYRIHEVRVLLADDPLQNAVVLCRTKTDDGGWTVIAGEYDAISQRWVAAEERIIDDTRLLSSGSFI